MVRNDDPLSSNRRILALSVPLVLLAVLVAAAMVLLARPALPTPVPVPELVATATTVAEAEATPTLQTLAMIADVTPPAPAATEPPPTAMPSATVTPLPADTPDIDPNPAASETVPVYTPTAVPTVVAKAPPTKKPTQGPQLQPNGVRYGDHTPNLPGRIVRIASPNIKLDTKVYEVYATSKGLWEVADYAAGHNFNSKNPGEGGNIVLAGHNNWRGEVFRYLEFLKPGNEIDVWTLEGKEYKYRVEQVEKLKEAGATMAQRLQNGKVMDPTPSEQLTLITCWPYTTFTHRLIVIAKPLQ